MTSRLEDERLALATQAAAILYALGGQRVWLFGSLGARRAQDRRSDLDLAVEGLPRGVLASAAPGLEATVGCRVDLVDATALEPPLRNAVVRTGVLLPRQPAPPAQPATSSSLWYTAPTRDPGRYLFLQRLDAILALLAEVGARSVVDLGCGAGWLVELLARDPRFERVTGIDLSDEALALARSRMERVLPAHQRAKVSLLLGIVTHRDPRLLGHDAAVACEVIEHMDEPRRLAFEHVVFDYLHPPTIVVTTPNIEYNATWNLDRRLRHPDHRFEWTRAEMETWARARAAASGYAVRVGGIGPVSPTLGTPTQLAVFTREAAS